MRFDGGFDQPHGLPQPQPQPMKHKALLKKEDVDYEAYFLWLNGHGDDATRNYYAALATLLKTRAFTSKLCCICHEDKPSDDFVYFSPCKHATVCWTCWNEAGGRLINCPLVE